VHASGFGRSPSKGRSAVWVDCIVCWLATVTVPGVVVGCWRFGRLELAEK
jgi:hypothetical protein